MDEDAIEYAHQLFDAARTGQTEFVTTAVDQGVPVNLSDASGNTMLMLAAYHGYPELVRELIDRGADVDQGNDRGQTPLAGAVFKKDIPIMRELVRGGADPDAGTPSANETAHMFGVSIPTNDG